MEEPLAMAVAIVIAFLLLGNLAVLLLTTTSKQLRQKHSVVFITNGAMANVIYSILLLAVSRNTIENPNTELCQTFDYLFYMMSTIMVWTVVVISLDKYCAVMKPFIYMQFCTVKRSWAVVAVLWIFSVILSVPIMVTIATSKASRFCYNLNGDARLPSQLLSEVIAITLIFALPNFILIALNIRLVTRLWSIDQSAPTTDQALLKSRSKVTKFAVIATVTFIISWLPYTVTSIWWCAGTIRSDTVEWVERIAVIVGATLTGVAPIYYALCNEAVFKEITGKCCHSRVCNSNLAWVA